MFFKLLENLKDNPNKPIILMGYFNLIYQMERIIFK